MRTVCLVLLCVIALTGSSARVLRGVGNGKPDHGHGNDQRRGPKFDFTDDGGADNFLAKMDQAKLDRILENSKSNALRGKLGKMLDEDPDMVRANGIEAISLLVGPNRPFRTIMTAAALTTAGGLLLSHGIV